MNINNNSESVEFNKYLEKFNEKEEEKKIKQRERSKKYYEENKSKICFKNRIYQLKKMKEDHPEAFNRFFSWLCERNKLKYLQYAQYMNEF